MKTVLLTLVFLLSSCSSQTDGDAKAPRPSALVTLARAQHGAIDQNVTLYGVARSGASGVHVLSAPDEATVRKIVAPVGAAVSRGQIVAQLEAAPLTRLAITKAAGDARLADAAYARARRLRADGLVGDADVEAARAAAKSADATRTNLSDRAAGMVLQASAAGHVESIAAREGDLVQAGAPVVTIASDENLRAQFGADPAVARSLHAGSPLTIEANAGHPALKLAISSINPGVDPQTRLASVFAPLPAAAGLAIGETLTGSVAIRASDDSAVTIPYAALLDDGGQAYVFVVTDDVAHRHDVTMGPVNGDRVAIDKGVAAGDMVVIDGGTAVEDGMKVHAK